MSVSEIQRLSETRSRVAAWQSCEDNGVRERPMGTPDRRGLWE